MNRKSSLSMILMEGVAMVPKFFAYIFHCWYYNAVTIFSLCLLARAYHVSFQLVENIISGCYCGLPHVYGQTSLYQ